MREFWVSSGHHLLDRNAGGRLVVTDDFLKAYLARPEILPPEDACAAERALHRRLVAAPRTPVANSDIARLADADAQDNWRRFIAFRDHLVRFPTLEAAYVALAQNGVGEIPPLLVDQLVHVILRNALDGEDDALVLRAGETFFRRQRLSRHDGTLLLADEETVTRLGSPATSPLLHMFGETPTDLDILGAANAGRYHARSDGFDFVLDFGAGRPARTAFARVAAIWLAHLLGIKATIEPIAALHNEAWHWFIGLDAEATRIGNALWRGEPVPDGAEERIVALFRLDLADGSRVLSRVAGRPIYLIMAVAPDSTLRVKPQNLIVGLPLDPAVGRS